MCALAQFARESVLHWESRAQLRQGIRAYGANFPYVVHAVIADVVYITLETLKKFDLPYPELLFGKPYSDIYADHLATRMP